MPPRKSTLLFLWGRAMSIIKKHLERTLPRIWDKVLEDPRRCEIRWDFSELVNALMQGLISGCKSFREIEKKTGMLGRRVPDTTLHDLAVELDPEPLEEELARGVKEANRSHELDNSELPVRLTVIDGKNLSTTSKSIDKYSINRSQKGCAKYVQHVLRAFHASSRVKLLMAQQRMPRGTNEKAILTDFLDKIVAYYGRTNLLEVFSFDAGFTSAKNSKAVIERGYHYIFALKNPQMYPITRAAIELLSNKTKPDKTETEHANGKEITRTLYCCAPPQVKDWEHARQLWRLQKVTTHRRTGEVTTENRYYVTSLPACRLSPSQVLRAIRLHWSIENNANWVMDTAWEEDKRPFANIALESISLMRMIAYNIVARFKLRRLRRPAAISWSWEETLEIIKTALFPLDERRAFATL